MMINPAVLSKRWGISLETAKRTLEVTTQSAIRNIFGPAERKIRNPAPWLNFPSITGGVYVDSMFSKVPAISDYAGDSVCPNYNRYYPWKRKSEHADTIMSFFLTLVHLIP
jgi:hypothetical protein